MKKISIHTKRVHPVYHYVLIPGSLILIPVSVLQFVIQSEYLAGIMLMVITSLLHISVFLTREYAKKNQDRIIRLETRLRYFQLTGKSFEQSESRLSTEQMVALRFANNEQFPVLIEEAIAFNLSPKEIKNNIINGVPDYMRV